MQGYTYIGQCESGKETAKAVEVNVGTGTGEDRWLWIPKSVLEIVGHHEYYVKSWFARQNKLYTTQRAF